MTPFIAAFAAMTIIGGLLLIAAGARPTPEGPARPPTSLRRRLLAGRTDPRVHAVAGLLAGVLVFAVSGWFIAVLVGPLAAVGVPYLLAPAQGAGIERLDAMAEWTRSLAGVLTVGMGLEQALIATQRSTPEPIRPDVDRLVVRLRARWTTEAAVRGFADDLDDATGDLIAAALILGSRRRGAGLAAVLNGLAESVAAEVRVRRQIEADRARPRSNARRITLITLAVIAGLFLLSPTYMSPYASPAGQVLLAVLLACFIGALLWLRSAATDRPLPRFLGTKASSGVRR